jgi:hypothetical protein
MISGVCPSMLPVSEAKNEGGHSAEQRYRSIVSAGRARSVTGWDTLKGVPWNCPNVGDALQGVPTMRCVTGQADGGGLMVRDFCAQSLDHVDRIPFQKARQEPVRYVKARCCGQPI